MRRIFFLMLVFCSCSGAAQELIVGAGLSVSQHDDLELRQKLDVYEIGLPLKSVQSYPDYLQYSVIGRVRVGRRFQLGGSIYTTSSAARSVYEDYSGIWRMDYKLTCIGFGVNGNFSIYNPTPSTAIKVYVMLGWDISKLEMEEYARTTGFYRTKSQSYKAASTMSEAGLEFQYFFSKKFFIHLNGGFHLNADAKLSSDDGIQPEYGSVNWLGLKAITGIGYRFDRPGRSQ
jgi:hypothetical protein